MQQLSASSGPGTLYALAERPAPVAVDVIVLGAADRASFIACLRSIRCQSLQSWRVMLPARQTEEMPDDLAADPRLVSVEGGEVAALRQVVAPFIGLIDARYTAEPTWLEKSAWLLATNPEPAFCGAHWAAVGGEEIWPYGFEQGPRFIEQSYCGLGVIFRREALDTELLGLAGAGPLGAWQLWLEQAARGRWGLTIAEPLLRAPFVQGTPEFWTDRPEPPDLAAQRQLAQRRFGGVRQAFPSPGRRELRDYEPLPEEPPFENGLDFGGGAARARLLILMPWLIVGGAERVNLDLIRQLGELGYAVSLAATLRDAQHPWIKAFQDLTPDVFVLDRFLPLLDVPRFLVYLIKSRRIDVVMISNSYLGYQLVPYLRARCPETTFVDYLHSQDEGWKSGGYPRAGVGYQSQLDLNITASQYVRDWMLARGADPSRIVVSYTNVDVDKWRRDEAVRTRRRSALGLGDDQTLIIFTGRLSPEKRPDLLAQIIAELRSKVGAAFRCLVLGDGPERVRLEQIIASLRLGDLLQIYGRVDDAQLAELLSAADVFLLPSQVEGVSVATFEAMAMSLVPVVSRVGGQAELVTPECGFTIEVRNGEVDVYAAILNQLISDHELRRRLGRAARQRVEQHFPLSRFGAQMAAHFEQARMLHATQARAVLDDAFAREYATGVLAHNRVEHAIDQIWVQRQQSPVIQAVRKIDGRVWPLYQRLVHVSPKVGRLLTRAREQIRRILTRVF